MHSDTRKAWQALSTLADTLSLETANEETLRRLAETKALADEQLEADDRQMATIGRHIDDTLGALLSEGTGQ